MKTKAYFVIALAVLFCVVGWSGYAQKERPAKVQWEHAQTSDFGEVQRLGADGWELVGVGESFSLNDGYGSTSTRFYLKRAR